MNFDAIGHKGNVSVTDDHGDDGQEDDDNDQCRQ